MTEIELTRGPDLDQEAERLAELIKAKAENLYLTKQLLCSEAVLYVINRALGGGLDDRTAVKLGSPLAIGMGEAGCTCGALSGAQLAVGLFLGRSRPAGPGSAKALKTARLVHDGFRTAHGSTCCRVLTKKVKHDKKVHFNQCAGLTGAAAEQAARIILAARPELTAKADLAFLEKTESKLGAGLKFLAATLSG